MRPKTRGVTRTRTHYSKPRWECPTVGGRATHSETTTKSFPAGVKGVTVHPCPSGTRRGLEYPIEGVGVRQYSERVSQSSQT